MSLVLVAVFVAPLVWMPLRQALANRALIHLGFVSYPLYLFHESVIVALMVKLGKLQLPIPDALLPLVPIAFAVTVAWIIATYAEPWVRERLRALLQRPPVDRRSSA